MPYAINSQFWNVCKSVDIIIGGINLVNEEHPYWSSGFWLFKSDTGIQAVFCRIMISLANSHRLWISNNILARSEKIWLHLKSISVSLCWFVIFKANRGKKYCEYLLYIELKAYLSVAICILNRLDWAKLERGNAGRIEPFQATLSAAYRPQDTPDILCPSLHSTTLCNSHG